MMAAESMAIAASGAARASAAMSMANRTSLREANGKKTPQGTKIADIKKGARDTVSEIASTLHTTSMVVSVSAFSRKGPRSAACWMEGGAAVLVNIIDCDASTDDVRWPMA